MASKQDRLDQAAALSKEKIAAEKRKLASIASAQREEQRKARDRRRYQVGTLAETCGILDVEPALLAQLFSLCARIAQQPTPGVTVAQCLRLVGGVPDAPEEGFAQALPGVSAAH